MVRPLKKKLGGWYVEGDRCGACWVGFCDPSLRRRCAGRNQDRYPLCLVRALRLDFDAGFQRIEAVDRPEECQWRRLCEGLRQEAPGQAHRLRRSEQYCDGLRTL